MNNNHATKLDPTTNRKHLVLSRWLDVTLLGIFVAGLDLVILSFLIRRDLQIDIPPIDLQRYMFGWALIILACLVLFMKPWDRGNDCETWWRSRQDAFRSAMHLRCWRLHAPTWVSVVVAITVLGHVIGSNVKILSPIEFEYNSLVYSRMIGALGTGFLLSALIQAWAWQPHPMVTKNSWVTRYKLFSGHFRTGSPKLIVRITPLLIAISIFSLPIFFWSEPPDAIVVSMVLGILIGTGFPYWAEPIKNSGQPPEQIELRPITDPPFNDFQKLIQWIQVDDPVTNISDDTLRHGALARKIAGRITSEVTPDMIVLGPLGSGKTTLGHFVEQELKSTCENVELVRIELWAFKSSDAAVAGILNALVKALSHWTDVVSIQGLTGRYLEAINSAGGGWNALFKLLPSSDVEKIITRFDNIAIASNRRFTLWIEDMERFAGNVGSPEERWKHWEKTQPLLALLFRLGEMKSTNFVIATTESNLSHDLDKLARFAERLPGFSKEVKAKTLSFFRKSCLSVSSSIIDPDVKLREELDLLEDPNHLRFRKALLGSVFAGASVACLDLCDGPRVFKLGLRRCWDLWNRYPGEISFDHLLIINLVRADSEAAFQSLLETRPLFLSQANSNRSRNNEKQEDPEAALRSLLAGEGVPGEKINSLVSIAKYLFEGKNDSGGQSFSVKTLRNQAYWDLFLYEPILKEEEKDQPILRVLRDGTNEDVINLLLNNFLREALLDFKFILGIERLKRVFPLLLDTLRKQLPSMNWVETGDTEQTVRPPGLENVWLLWTDFSKNGLLSNDELWPIIKDSIPKNVRSNLTLAFEVDYLFVTASQEVHSLLNESQSLEARKILQSSLIEAFSGNPNGLARALEFQSAPVLNWLLWGLEKVRRVSNELAAGSPVYGGNLPFEDGWDNFAATILDAVKFNPQACIVQLSWILVDTISDFGGITYKFNAELAARLFGGMENLREILRPHHSERWTHIQPVKELFSGLTI